MQPARPGQKPPSPIVAVNVNAGLTSELLLAMAENRKAVILGTNAMGQVGDRLHPALQNLRDKQIPVFILPDNACEQHGVIRVVEEAQKAVERNGGIFLEKANINNEQEVIQAVQEALDKGKTGTELGEAIREQYAYKEGEERPGSRLGTPEGLRGHKRDVEVSMRG